MAGRGGKGDVTLRFCALGGAVLAGLLALAVLPAVLAAGTQRPGCGVVSAEVDGIAATIRQLESGGDYTARASGSTASGAYQFLDSSWASYDGYPRAWLAPPAVQDAKAAELIAAILAANNGDVAAVPVAWYLGHVPAAGSQPSGTPSPHPERATGSRPRQYQTRWMAAYDALSRTGPADVDGADQSPRSSCRGCRRRRTARRVGATGTRAPSWRPPPTSSTTPTTTTRPGTGPSPPARRSSPSAGGTVIALSTNSLQLLRPGRLRRLRARRHRAGLRRRRVDLLPRKRPQCEPWRPGPARPTDPHERQHRQQHRPPPSPRDSSRRRPSLPAAADHLACPHGTGIDPASLPTTGCSY